MTWEDDRRIDDFLRRYEPAAPLSPPTEYARIVSAAEEKANAARKKNRWIGWSIAAFVAIALAGIASELFRSREPAAVDSPVAQVSVENGEQEIEGDWEDAAGEEAGFEYIRLAQAVSD